MATSSTRRESAPSSCPAWRNSCASSGQSVVQNRVEEGQQHHLAVQTGQRDIPAMLVGEAERRGGGVQRGAGAVDGLRQDGVGDRAGLGGGHRRRAQDDDADRADRSDGADAGRGQRPRRGGDPEPVPPAGRGRRAAGRFCRLGGSPGHGEVSGGGQQHHRDHAVGVGAQAAEEPEVLDQHPVRQAQHGEPDQDRADQPRSAGQECGAGDGERGHHEQVHREPVRLVEGGERVDPGGQEPGLRRLGHRVGHSGQRAGLAVRDALPEPPPRPGLQDRHADQERARQAVISRPSHRLRQARSGSAISAPATA